MRYCLELPVTPSPADLVAVAQAAEDAGFAMLGFTDHPAPSAKWMAAGGHPTFDPFAALSFVAAVTTRVRLMTHLAVLPYRNPLLLAKSVATIDCLSGGRFTLVAGTGYLRSEFAALGADFDGRNAAFEDAVSVLREVFVGESYNGVAHDPKPVQLPHPPIWIGGSSRTSRERVARYGDGWAPLYVNEVYAKTVRTAPISSDGDLGRAIDELRALVAAEGRDPATISIQLDGAVAMTSPPGDVEARAAELEALGVTHLVLRPPPGSTSGAVDAIGAYAGVV